MLVRNTKRTLGGARWLLKKNSNKDPDNIFDITEKTIILTKQAWGLVIPGKIKWYDGWVDSGATIVLVGEDLIAFTPDDIEFPEKKQ